MTAPTAARPQHMDALDRANEVKHVQKQLRDDLRGLDQHEARRRAADWIEQAPDHPCARMHTGWLLRACPRVGAALSNRWLRFAGVVTDSRKVGDLTPRQRERLVQALRGEAC